MSVERVGDWMQTYTGIAFWPLDPRPDEVDIEDIAHHLSLLCRFNGAVREHYSVAEHCVHVSRSVPAEDALWGLLHDATEAYIGDMIRPLKRVMPDYVVAEDRLMAIIGQRFGLSPTVPVSVKAADNRVLVNERMALLGQSPHPWAAVEDLNPLPGVVIQAWEPAMAEAIYAERFVELCGWAS